MIQIRLQFRRDWTTAALLVVLLLGLLFAGRTAAREQHSVPPYPQAAFSPGWSGRHVYLTRTAYLPTQAVVACADGYHMASLWEILDTSSLVYDAAHPDAMTRDDSGQGPPSFTSGWVRTGQDGGVAIPGQANCLNWSVQFNYYSGTVIRLSHDWPGVPANIGSWVATTIPCDQPTYVWCVGDVYKTYLPLVGKNL